MSFLRVERWKFALVLLACAIKSLHADESAFQNLSFQAALTQAGLQKKIVLVDFFTTWCGPCKMLDMVTWRDAGVIKLLRDKTVAVRIDAEKDKALAARYGVSAYPTLALIRPDGTLIDRLVGYKDPTVFTQNFISSLAGKTSLSRAQDAVNEAVGKSIDTLVQARFNLGQQLAQNGRDADALAQFLWCYDDGMKQAQDFTGVRVSFLLVDLDSLARHYTPAHDAMIQRRDLAKKLMTSDPSATSAAQDLAALNHYLGCDDATLAIFDNLPAASPLRQKLGFYVFDQLLAAKRYNDAVKAIPYADFMRTFGYMAQSMDKGPPQAADSMKSFLVEDAAKEIEALAGANQLPAAKSLIAAVLKVDSSIKARSVLHDHLARAGHADLL
jgi:thioredoxin 1